MALSFDLLLGSFLVLFGFYTLVARQIAPQQFSKLGPMKEKFGDKVGLTIHFVAYTVLPLACGATILSSILLK